MCQMGLSTARPPAAQRKRGDSSIIAAMPATHAERRELRKDVGDSRLRADNERVIPLFSRLCEMLAAARTAR